MMESDRGKLFVGGISWETTEDHLREYFKTFGEVVEAVIMKDRATGRARGFGFIVFADPSVADRVISEKHMIDGRMVEAKKAVPRDDQHILNRNISNIHGSGSPARTKKIFVGGLASTVTESDFKAYFDQFGTITDVVVMYDHNTQRPRGFGFITYDSEDAVDRVLFKIFHELNGKMVEVKRAVPKELSPGPNRPLLGISSLGYGLNRFSNLLNGYCQGYNSNLLGPYQMRMDGRFNPLSVSRPGYSALGPLGYGLGANFRSSLSPSYGGSSFGANLNYSRGLNSYYSGDSGRYNSTLGYSGINGIGESIRNSPVRDLWGNVSLNGPSITAGSADYPISGSGVFGNGASWGLSPVSIHGGESNVSYVRSMPGSGNSSNTYRLESSGFGDRIGRNGISPEPYGSFDFAHNGTYSDLYGANSVCGDTTWRSIPESDRPSSFSYGFGNSGTNSIEKASQSFTQEYNATNRHSNGGVVA